MSKQTGNFLTLAEGVGKYSADGMRLALADAGDSINDANFDEAMAEAGVLRLYNLLDWVAEVTGHDASVLRSGQERNWADKAFDNAMNAAIAATRDQYQHMLYKEALKTGFFEYQVTNR